MTTVPSLPTDNLYKFLALSGVLLVVVSIVAPHSRVTELLEQDAMLKVQIEELNARAEAFAESQTRVNEGTVLQEMRRTAAELRELIYETRRKSELKDIQLDVVQEELIIYRIAKIAGLLLALFGFSLWYIQVQRYQDNILQNEASRSHIDESGGTHRTS